MDLVYIACLSIFRRVCSFFIDRSARSTPHQLPELPAVDERVPSDAPQRDARQRRALTEAPRANLPDARGDLNLPAH